MIKPVCVFSPDRRYRYTLRRDTGDLWSKKGSLVFIGLNPSTADEENDDRTCAKCRAWSETWGFREYVMLNLFAFRATDPRDMKAEPEPVGPDNDQHLLEETYHADMVIAAWGANGSWMNREEHVLKLLKDRKLYYLKLTTEGHPYHPLYLPNNTEPQLWHR